MAAIPCGKAVIRRRRTDYTAQQEVLNMDKNAYSAGLWVFAQSVEKFGGYTGTHSTREQIKLAASVPGLKGLELIAPLHVTVENANDVKGWLEDAGLKAVSINPYLWTESTWKRGAFTSPDPKVRRQA